jgi:hypothetical protein
MNKVMMDMPTPQSELLYTDRELSSLLLRARRRPGRAARAGRPVRAGPRCRSHLGLTTLIQAHAYAIASAVTEREVIGNGTQ